MKILEIGKTAIDMLNRLTNQICHAVIDLFEL